MNQRSIFPAVFAVVMLVTVLFFFFYIAAVSGLTFQLDVVLK